MQIVWDEIQKPAQAELLRRAFTSTGCLIQIYPVISHSIVFKDIENYSF